MPRRIRETTITFENVQNVSMRQGPLQRLFGIANVIVETAGGGQAQEGSSGGQAASAHLGLIEGIDDADRIRDLILQRLRLLRGQTKTTTYGTTRPVWDAVPHSCCRRSLMIWMSKMMTAPKSSFQKTK